MRTDAEVEQFFARMTQKYPEEQAVYYTHCYEACIPQLFWEVSSSRVFRNQETFEKVVLLYCKRWRRALKNGYGLMLTGDNGTGKTMFLTFILTQMIKRGASVYYTTLPKLDVNIKRGFGDRGLEARLEEMMDSDYVVIDELGKEYKKKDSYIKMRFESAVKERYDNGHPTLFASNYSIMELRSEYGPSVASMWRGKTKVVELDHGDHRRRSSKTMEREMFG